MNNVKLIRLHNGDDIIATYEIKEDRVIVSEPMLVQMHLQGTHMGLVLQHWLPVQIVKSNETEINLKDILCFIEPTDNLTEYYTNSVEKIKNLFSARDALDSEEVEDIEDEMESISLAMEELIEDSNVVIH
jgi:hypothetical protein